MNLVSTTRLRIDGSLDGMLKSNDLKQRVERRLGALDFGTIEESIEPSSEVIAALIEELKNQKLALLSWTKAARSLQDRANFRQSTFRR